MDDSAKTWESLLEAWMQLQIASKATSRREQHRYSVLYHAFVFRLYTEVGIDIRNEDGAWYWITSNGKRSRAFPGAFPCIADALHANIWGFASQGLHQGGDDGDAWAERTLNAILKSLSDPPVE